MTMVRGKDWKLVHFLGEPYGQLFDLVNDPGEMTPVTYKPEYRHQLLAHRYILLEWDQRIGDKDFSPAGKFPEYPEAGRRSR